MRGMEFIVHHQTVGPHRNGQNNVNEGFFPIATRCNRYIAKLFIYPIVPCPENTFDNFEFDPTDLLILYSDHCDISFYPIAMSKLLLEPEDFQPRACISDEFSASERVVKEFMINLMTE
jgi:hypothetical protein